ncbi:MAG TPA: hypothetical protein VGM51_07250 [Armatimonadota bacterium]|jgi:hypothetical protein
MERTREIVLTGQRGGVALVDEVDYEYLNRWKWHQNACGYAVRNSRIHTVTGCIRMHRAVLKPPETYQADHLNGNCLDNRRANLRAVLPGTNVRNRPGNPNAYSLEGTEARFGFRPRA